MSYEMRADYSKQWLLPPALEEWVGANHPARFIREFVEALDLEGEGFSVRESPEGRPNYASDHLLKVVLYGYFNRIRSFRKLEAACHEQMGLIWLTGRLVPDHNTLWRFWRENRRGLRRLLRLGVRAAMRANLVGLALHAADGTKMRAQASNDSAKSSEQVKELLEALDRSIEQYFEELDRAGEREQGQAGYELPEHWGEQMLRREQLRELAQQMEIEERSSIGQLEREARFMKTRSEGTVLAYNAQSVVDEQSGLIVAADVIGEGNDNHALVPMLEQVEENLGEVAQQTVADAGYFSGEQLEAAEGKRYPILVNESEEGKSGTGSEYHASRFVYDEQKDCCICPRGQELRFRGQKTGPRGELLREYHCGQYKQCPVRWTCSKEKRGRTIRLGVHHQAIRRQRQKREEPGARALMSQRKRIVEPVFGLIRAVMEFRRFSVAGIEATRVQWSLVCTAFNLRRLYPHWVTGRLQFAT
jgi:transposase